MILGLINRNPTGQVHYLATVGYSPGHTVERKAAHLIMTRLDSRRDDIDL